ncbi:MAG: DUF3791 domain-containing protein, partial [Thermoguttaceae bacterium]
MDNNKKKIEFVAFCIEMYARDFERSGTEVCKNFEKFGVLDYLFCNYEALHTQGWGYSKDVVREFTNEQCENETITQKNFRALLPGKIADVVEKIRLEKNISSKEALLFFYSSEVYRELEIADYAGLRGGFFVFCTADVATNRFSNQQSAYRLPFSLSAGQRAPPFA